jgi:hypothetical protein
MARSVAARKTAAHAGVLQRRVLADIAWPRSGRAVHGVASSPSEHVSTEHRSRAGSYRNGLATDEPSARHAETEDEESAVDEGRTSLTGVVLVVTVGLLGLALGLVAGRRRR